MTATVEPHADLEPIRVVLVDPHRERRAVMRHLFEHSAVGTTVVGEADTQADAINSVDQQRAELVVIDFTMPVDDGMETVAALRCRFPDLTIVVCSFRSDAATSDKAREVGADAYLVKPVSARQVMAAVPGLDRGAGSVRQAATVH